ncbi:MAG: hypothetical protein V3V16_02140 [Melioribacteraceae bacterium]
MWKIIENVTNIFLVCFLMLTLIFTPIVGKFSNIIAQSQSECEKELANAQSKYDSGQFDEAVVIITQCLGKENLSQDSKMKAYRLLGLTYIANDYLKEAKTAVSKLLDIVPNYQPDLEQDPPTFVNLVTEKIEERKTSEIKTEVQTTKTSKKKKSSNLWYYIAGGAAAVVAVVVLLLSGGSDPPPTSESDLPGPPDLP